MKNLDFITKLKYKLLNFNHEHNFFNNIYIYILLFDLSNKNKKQTAFNFKRK